MWFFLYLYEAMKFLTLTTLILLFGLTGCQEYLDLNDSVYAFILHLFLKTEYSIDKAKLTIKCGVFSYQPIDIQQIKEVSTTKSLISSPAPSFDRIQINFGKFDEIIISPRNKFNFVRDLIKINPAIKNNLFE